MPSPAKQKKKTSSSGAKPQGDRRPKYDWNAIRREYIRGDESVTFTALAARDGYPTKRAIEKRSSAEDWVDLKAEFVRQVDGRLRQLDLDMKTEVRVRQARLGKSFIHLAVRGLSHQKPELLEPVDIARYAKIGAELERKALGMEEVSIKIGRIRSPDDLDKHSEAELWQLAGMLPPDENEDDDF
ncbi:hypothetical protein ACFP9V_19390 [Deinococcus radiopugnans]|uniref:Uncharacterized protein n=1 Tax=Deinococcus radiopugnans ATCC 19172 TaxID=585398 RepID=A0A5C4Y9Z1_9DEIO|nr:hypothetical protein [Deinococcus radiopugnans]MBB6016790.1 hypothetical protein [Deinococcus radiopugnans ATCC 19172]TNM71920.1 hypothetical protein FHR04_06005 [Deinococcus radiopugnans ATCC 19172]